MPPRPWRRPPLSCAHSKISVFNCSECTGPSDVQGVAAAIDGPFCTVSVRSTGVAHCPPPPAPRPFGRAKLAVEDGHGLRAQCIVMVSINDAGGQPLHLSLGQQKVVVTVPCVQTCDVTCAVPVMVITPPVVKVFICSPAPKEGDELTRQPKKHSIAAVCSEVKAPFCTGLMSDIVYLCPGGIWGCP